MEFTHETLPQRVRFGAGRALENVVGEVRRRSSSRVMVIASPREEAFVARLAERIPVTLAWSEVVEHVPVGLAERARRASIDAGIDLLVCVGGGSATGLAKAVALVTGQPIVAVPSTYAGSEATDVWGITEDARKTTGTDRRVLPVAVIYDAELTASLPVGLSVTSGLNALAHGVDSMWAPRTDPINRALASEGIRALADGLPQIVRDPTAVAGREQVQYGAYLTAVAFASAGSGMHHKLCHVLGGTFGLPHAATHAIVLPHVLAFNAPSAPEAERRIAAALGASDALQGLLDLRTALDAPTALHDLGFAESDIPDAVQIALPLIPADNPRRATPENLAALLLAAWAGDDPLR